MNVGLDALSCKYASLQAQLWLKNGFYQEQVAEMNAEFRIEDMRLRMSSLKVQPLLISHIREL